jgi:hypothetical protein
MSACRVRLVVLDGLDWQYCLRAFDNAKVPVGLDVGDGTHVGYADDPTAALWAALEDGCAAPLEACKAPVTSDAVATLLTGRDLELSFTEGDHFANSQDLIRTRPWFGELARHGMSLALCNVPLTWPAFPVPGPGSWLTSGYPVTRPDRSSWGLTRDQLHGYPLPAMVDVANGGDGGSSNLPMLCAAEKELVGWFERLDHRCTVEIVWLRSSDSAGHHAWGTADYDAVVAHLGGQVRRLRKDCDNCIVISDHGFDAVDSPRCEAYMATNHGPPTRRAGLVGAHTMDGVLFASGKDITARGILPRQRILEVAGGLFDLLGIPPAPGMLSVGPAWTKATTAADDDRVREAHRKLGYVE